MNARLLDAYRSGTVRTTDSRSDEVGAKEDKMATRNLLAAGVVTAGMVCCAAVTTAGLRPDDTAARKQIEAQYAKFARAMKAKDVNGIMAIAAPGFTEQEATGQVYTAEQSRKMMDEQFKSLKAINKFETKVNKLTVNGSTAVASTSYDLDGTVTGPDGKPHHMTDSGTMRDTWVKQGGAWKVKSVKSLTDHMTMDGKPFNPMAPPAPRKKHA